MWGAPSPRKLWGDRSRPCGLRCGDLELVQGCCVRGIRGAERHTNYQSERSLRSKADARQVVRQCACGQVACAVYARLDTTHDARLCGAEQGDLQTNFVHFTD